ncbi:CLK4-associating serine/arginine rich protein isoform X2 [Clinocottus analis]|uniref:CLK4-associating serine/arginine rich protein isoform X2 n=1 Tax=Clinocottus analis TaxID=304258 RepID=UPI0035BF82DD
MWQEARKHERKLRGMMVDYKRRGERRREYYEKIKKDPAQFLQVHGRAYKIHLDPAVAMAAESPINMMPWQGDANNMIDRFDVRAHLDYIPTYTPPLLSTSTPDQETEERKCNYERYRGLVQNDFANISEEQCLYQIYLDELYGGLQKPNEDEKKKLAEKKATIGYTYEDSTVAEPEPESDKEEENSESESEEDEGIPDIDVEVDVDELNQEQVLDVNKMATPYGMAEGDFVRMLRKDKEEVEAIKHAKALEAEKAMYSGRRSRRQRREFREKRLKGRQISPPSYARRDSPTYDPYKRPESESSSESRSRSRSPGPEKITFITSYGGSDDEAVAAAAAAAATAASAAAAAATAAAAAAKQTSAPHSGHAPSSLQHPAGHSRGSRSETKVLLQSLPFLLLLPLFISVNLSLFLPFAAYPPRARDEGRAPDPDPIAVKTAFQISLPGQRRERKRRILEETRPDTIAVHRQREREGAGEGEREGAGEREGERARERARQKTILGTQTDEVALRLTAGGEFQARGSEQRRPQEGGQRQLQSLSVPRTPQPQPLPSQRRPTYQRRS